MEVAIAKLRETRGEVAPLAAVILIIFSLLFSMAIQYNHVYAVIDKVIGKTDEAVLAAAAKNGSEIFQGIRESAGTARQNSGGSWTHMVDTSAVEEALRLSLGAVHNGDGFLVEGSFRITDLKTVAENAEGGNLNFTTTLTLEIPLSIGGTFSPLSIRHWR